MSERRLSTVNTVAAHRVAIVEANLDVDVVVGHIVQRFHGEHRDGRTSRMTRTTRATAWPLH
jgi:hypothetical protein